MRRWDISTAGGMGGRLFADVHRYRRVAAADLNGDGIPDVVIENGFAYSTYRCSVTTLLGNGDGTFQPPSHSQCSLTSQVSANGNASGIAIADFTGDGKPDIAALYSFNDGYVKCFRATETALSGARRFTSSAALLIYRRQASAI